MTMHTTLWWFRGPQPPRLRPRQPQTECFSTMPRSFAPILIMGLQVGIQANFCSFSSPFESLRDRPSTGSGTALRLALGPPFDWLWDRSNTVFSLESHSIISRILFADEDWLSCCSSSEAYRTAANCCACAVVPVVYGCAVCPQIAYIDRSS